MSIKVGNVEQVVQPFPIQVLYLGAPLMMGTIEPGILLSVQTWGRFKGDLSPVGHHYILESK